MGIFSDNQYVTNLDPPLSPIISPPPPPPLLSALDVDECSKDNVCVRGQCVNTDGSFLCLCEAGFKFNTETAYCEGKTD